MPPPVHVLVPPIPVAPGPGDDSLAAAVAADAVVRRLWAAGRQATLAMVATSGDPGTQYAFERELGREGLDRASLPLAELAERARQFEAERLHRLASVLERLQVGRDLARLPLTAPDTVSAARVAFVRLFEEGRIERTSDVVDRCPRCAIGLDATDVEGHEEEVEELVIRLAPAGDPDAQLELVVTAAELLPGAVAVAAPAGHPAVGRVVALPLAGRDVPVVPTDATTAKPVVPAHDAAAAALARTFGLAAVPVLGDDNVVEAPGPLQGLTRFAARVAAAGILEAEEVVVERRSGRVSGGRCRWCATAVVPRAQIGYFLRIGDLEIAAADAVRDGAVAFSPVEARDLLLAHAGSGRRWLLSTATTTGPPIPAAVCDSCTQLAISVVPERRCWRCMGELVAEPWSIDARFLAVVWALAQPPGRSGGRTEVLAVVTPSALHRWCLPALALGLRLNGGLPFDRVAVHPVPGEGVQPSPDAAALLDKDADERVVRLALALGTGDVDLASAAIAVLDGQSAVDHDVTDVAAAAVAALDEAVPGRAAAMLASALTAGVSAEGVERLGAVTLPILGR